MRVSVCARMVYHYEAEIVSIVDAETEEVYYAE